jgi:hypothetical protein
MEDFYRLFHINSRHCVLVCTNCTYAVVPTQIGKDLRAHQIHLSLQQRRATVSGVEELVELVGMPSDVVYPSPSDLPVTHLAVHFDDLKWNGYDAQGAVCSYIGRTQCGMREHCGQKYGWINSQKRGSDTRSKQTNGSNEILDREPCMSTVLQGCNVAAMF